MKQFLALLLLSLYQISMAQFIDGNELKRLSDAYSRVSQHNPVDGDYQDASQFIGYTQGAHDANQAFFCSPDSFKTRQLTEVVSSYLRANPSKWHFSGDKLIVLALAEAFPCRKTVPFNGQLDKKPGK